MTKHIAYIRYSGPAHGVRHIGGAYDHPLWAETLCGRLTTNNSRIFGDPHPASAITCRSCRRLVASNTDSERDS